MSFSPHQPSSRQVTPVPSTTTVLAPPWLIGHQEPYPMLTAPTKDLMVLDTSGHRPLFEQPDDFVAYMVGTVLAETNPS